MALSSGSDTEGAGAAFRKQPLLSPHNMYLLVLSEQGALGATALVGGWLALLVCGMRGLIRVRRGTPGAYGTPGAPGGAHVRGLAHEGVPRGLDCALLACGLLIWQLVDFAYGDIGGPSTTLTAVCLGLVARWALADPACAAGPPVRPRTHAPSYSKEAAAR